MAPATKKTQAITSAKRLPEQCRAADLRLAKQFIELILISSFNFMTVVRPQD